MSDTEYIEWLTEMEALAQRLLAVVARVKELRGADATTRADLADIDDRLDQLDG